MIAKTGTRVALMGLLVVFAELVVCEDKPNELNLKTDVRDSSTTPVPLQPANQGGLNNQNHNNNNQDGLSVPIDDKRPNNDDNNINQYGPAVPIDDVRPNNDNTNYELGPPNRRDQQQDNGFGFHRRDQSFDNGFMSPFSSPFGGPFQSPFGGHQQQGLLPRPSNFLSHLLGGSDLFDSMFKRSHEMFERRFQDISSQPLGVTHERFTRNGVTYVRTCETKRLGDNQNQQQQQQPQPQQQQKDSRPQTLEEDPEQPAKQQSALINN